MKCVLSLTQDCNLACDYCYSHRSTSSMTADVLRKSVDFIFTHRLSGEKLSIGFFGGEPLLKFHAVKKAVALIKNHPLYDPKDVQLSLISNGTIYAREIVNFIGEHDISFGISCDGSPDTHNRFRRFHSGAGTGNIVEANIKRYVKTVPNLMVNAVYRPETVEDLPRTVLYFSSLGVRQIYLTPDYSAEWTEESARQLQQTYRKIGDLFIHYYEQEDPHYISLIDSKITVILRDGYRPEEKCQMGKKEWAFSSSGKIYPCERLIGNDDGTHAIGDVDNGISLENLQCRSHPKGNNQCGECTLNRYCMNWCGCSNFMASGFYNRSSAFLCASEQASIREATRVFEQLKESSGPLMLEHLSGNPLLMRGRK